MKNVISISGTAIKAKKCAGGSFPMRSRVDLAPFCFFFFSKHPKGAPSRRFHGFLARGYLMNSPCTAFWYWPLFAVFLESCALRMCLGTRHRFRKSRPRSSEERERPPAMCIRSDRRGWPRCWIYHDHAPEGSITALALDEMEQRTLEPSFFGVKRFSGRCPRCLFADDSSRM